MTYEKETKEIASERQPSAAGIPATYLSLCSGYDGIGIALQRIYGGALRTLAHVEIEAFAIANLVAKMEEGSLDSCPVFTDVKRFPFEDLRGRVGILSAGFPCQPFSSAGKRQATDDPRHIYPYIADGISACRPAYVLLENVEGIISAKTGDGESVLKHVLSDLESRGYVCAWGVFSACEILGQDGRRIPHQRRRVFILAKLADRDVEGLEGHGGSIVESEASERDGEGNERLASAGSVQRSVYPARPNEPQRWWEEPRVVGDAKSVVRQRADGETNPSGRSQEEVGGHGAGGGEEGVVNSSTDGRRPHQPNTQADGVVGEGEEGRVSESSGGRAELADSNSGRQPPRIESRSGEKADSRRQENSIEGYGVGELADSKGGKPRKSKGGDGRKDTGGGSEEVGQLGDASSERLPHDVQEQRQDAEKGLGEGVSQQTGEQEACREPLPETQPELGGAVDAWGGLRGVDPITNRVDRLRLLGNGVVPATCELAFTTLYNRLNGDNDQ